MSRMNESCHAAAPQLALGHRPVTKYLSWRSHSCRQGVCVVVCCNLVQCIVHLGEVIRVSKCVCLCVLQCVAMYSTFLEKSFLRQGVGVCV